MTTPLDTKDWRLVAFLNFKCLTPQTSIDCPCCNGRGEVGGGFKDMDGPRPCPECFGSRVKWSGGPTTPKPTVPPLLVEHMRKALFAYFDEWKPASAIPEE